MPRRARTINRRLTSKGTAIVLIAALLAAGAAWGFSGSTVHHRRVSPFAEVAAARKRLPRPLIAGHPDAQTTSTIATFRLSDRAGHVRLECHLDASAWGSCGRTITYASVESGTHRFFARAARRGARTSSIASFSWMVEVPVPPAPPVNPSGLPFEIAQAGPPPLLYPGAGPSPLPVTLLNPNPDPIQFTSLSAAVTAGPAGCDPPANFRVEPSPVSPADPLVIPAGGTLPVTAAQAPTIELIESGRNQDACRGGSFSLSFTGSAQG
jgi:hypothetical protein